MNVTTMTGGNGCYIINTNGGISGVQCPAMQSPSNPQNNSCPPGVTCGPSGTGNGNTGGIANILSIPKPPNPIVCGSIRDSYTRAVNEINAGDWTFFWSGTLLGGWTGGAKGAVSGALTTFTSTLTSAQKIKQLGIDFNAKWQASGCTGTVQNGAGLLDMPPPGD